MNHKEIYTSLGVPESYFDDLETAILRSVETLELENELKKTYGDYHGLSTPVGYFNELEKEILTLDSSKNMRSFKYSAAAAVIAIGMFAFSMFNSENELAEEKTFDELLAEVEFSDSTLELFQYEELGEFISDETLEEDDIDEALEYLLESDEDLDFLTDELIEI